MADGTNTALAGSGTTTGSTPGNVATLTVIATVIGALLTALSGWLTTYATTHATTVWPQVVLGVIGVVLLIAAHYGYSKSATVTTNATVNALLAAATAGVPFAMDLLAQYVLKDPTASAQAPATAGAPVAGASMNPSISVGGSAVSVPK